MQFSFLHPKTETNDFSINFIIISNPNFNNKIRGALRRIT